MSFQDEFSRKVKEYLEPDPDEEILEREYNKLVLNYFTSLNKKIGKVKRDRQYYLRCSSEICCVKIDDVELSFNINKENNTVEVIKRIRTAEYKIDTWVIKDNSLYSEKRNAIPQNELIDEYLKETFKDLLNL